MGFDIKSWHVPCDIFAIMCFLQIVIFLQLCDFYKLVAFCCFDGSSEVWPPRLDRMEWILKRWAFYFQNVLFSFLFSICFVLYIFFLPWWAPALAFIAIFPFPFWLKDIFAFLPTRFSLNIVLFQKWSQWAIPSLYDLLFAVLVFFFFVKGPASFY